MGWGLSAVLGDYGGALRGVLGDDWSGRGTFFPLLRVIPWVDI